MTCDPAVRVDVVYVDSGAIEPVLRATLGRRLDVPPAAVEITRQCEHCGHATHGRPRLVDGAISFSVSHSAQSGVIALSTGHRVGVDVERVHERRYLARLAARTLSPDALAAWWAAPEWERLDRFLRAWTMKEAYLKGIGLGLATTLARVPEQPDGWAVHAIDAPAGYIASIAVETDGPVVIRGGTAG